MQHSTNTVLLTFYCRRFSNAKYEHEMVFYHFVMIGDERKLSVYANGWLAYSH